MDTAARFNRPSTPPEPPDFAPEVVILTAGKQLTLPDSIAADFPGVDCFALVSEGERIVLTPLQPTPIEEIHRHTANRGITEQDVADAVKWARGQR